MWHYKSGSGKTTLESISKYHHTVVVDLDGLKFETVYNVLDDAFEALKCEQWFVSEMDSLAKGERVTEDTIRDYRQEWGFNDLHDEIVNN